MGKGYCKRRKKDSKEVKKCLTSVWKMCGNNIWTCPKKSAVTRYSGHHFSRLGCFWPTHDQTTDISYCMREGNSKCKYFLMLVPQTKSKAGYYSLSSTLQLWEGWLFSDRVVDTPDHQDNTNLEEIEAEREGSVHVKLFVSIRIDVCDVRRVWITCW